MNQSPYPLMLGVAVLAATIPGCDGLLDPDEPGNLVPPTVAEDASLPAIEMNGSRFHAETFGDPANPVVVFLHGGPGGDYRSLLRLGERIDGYSLADDYFLVYWDQRGAGLSTRYDKDMLTHDVYAADLDALAERYSPDQPIFLIGHSWGGMYAAMYINDYPDRVAGAVLIEPGPMDGATMEDIKDDLFDMDLGAEWLNDWAWSSQFLTPDDHARMDYERALGVRNSQPNFHISTDDPAPYWRLGAAAARYVEENGQDHDGVFVYDFAGNLDLYPNPVLFIAGAWSEVLGESLQQEQMLRFSSASLEVIPDAGHDVEWVQAPLVLGHIRAYLDARTGGTP